MAPSTNPPKLTSRGSIRYMFLKTVATVEVKMSKQPSFNPLAAMDLQWIGSGEIFLPPQSVHAEKDDCSVHRGLPVYKVKFII